MKKVSLLIILLFSLFLMQACKAEKQLPVQFDIRQDAGIEIAVGDVSSDAKSLTWKSTLTEQEVNRYLLKKYDDLILTQVTSPNGKDFYTISDVLVTTGYIEFPIHFRSNTADKIYIDHIMMNSTTIDMKPEISFTNSKNMLIAPTDTMPIKVTDAVRISFESDQFMFVYESPESDTNTVLGKQDQADLSSAKGAIDYYRQITSMLPIGIHQVSVVETTSLSSKALVVDMLSNQVEVHGQMYYGFLVIRVWIEGWDYEAYNHILDSKFSISIRFVN